MSTKSKLIAEFVGTMSLLIIIVGSGIMGESLAGGNEAIALLANSIATGAGLFVLIQCFGPISGAHFNPVVTFSEWLSKNLSLKEFVQYAIVQITGAIFGVLTTHLIFGLPLIQLSTKDRSDLHLAISEIVATAGLLTVISLTGKKNPRVAPASIALFITSAYWFTSSTAFANPAVTIARSLTDTFSGIMWIGSFAFVTSQFAGAILAFFLLKALTTPPDHCPTT